MGAQCWTQEYTMRRSGLTLCALGLLLVLCAVCSDALSTGALRAHGNGPVDVQKLTDSTLKNIKMLIDKELSDPVTVKPNYIVERQYYNFWTTATLFKVLESVLQMPEGSLRDKKSLPTDIDQSRAAVMAQVAYGTRHYLRNKIREREEQRPCMAAVVKLLRYRDLKVYGSVEGPTWQQLINAKYAKKDPNSKPPTDPTKVDKDICLSLVFSAASPNFYVNTLTKFLEKATGNTLSTEQKRALMTHAGLTQTQIEDVLGAPRNGGQCAPKDRQDSWVMDYLLQTGYYNEFNDDDEGLLTVPPRAKVM